MKISPAKIDEAARAIRQSTFINERNTGTEDEEVFIDGFDRAARAAAIAFGLEVEDE